MAPTAFSFDVDGTLADTFPWYADTLRLCAGDSRFEVEERLRGGANLVHTIRDAGVGVARFMTLSRRRRAAIVTYPGVGDTLGALTSRGIPLGIVSSLPAELVAIVLEGCGLSKYFRSVIHAGNCRVKKPRAEPLLRCFAELGVGTAGGYYVGDRSVDQQAAASAGVRFAWASYGYDDGVIGGLVDLRLDQPSDLLKL